MASIMINPTRMELARLKKKLVTAKRGYKLLKDKRDELMRQFLELVKDNMSLRERVEDKIVKANQSFVLAKAVLGEKTVSVALIASKQNAVLEVKNKNIMSVLVPEFDYKPSKLIQEHILQYGFAFTSRELDFAVKAFSEVLMEMIELAEMEKTCQLLAFEIEKTRRRVNALEYVVIPETEQNIRYITMKLEENERSTQVRLMKVKDMMVKARIVNSKNKGYERRAAF